MARTCLRRIWCASISLAALAIASPAAGAGRRGRRSPLASEDERQHDRRHRPAPQPTSCRTPRPRSPPSPPTAIENARITQAGRFHQPHAQRDPGRDAERRQRLHRHPRHHPGAQQRALGRGGRRRGAAGQSGAVQPGPVRHRADRSAQGPAGRPLRPQRDRRRDHHQHQGAERHVRRQGHRRASTTASATSPAAGSAGRSGECDQVPPLGLVLRHRRLHPQPVPRRGSRSATRTSRCAATCCSTLGGELEIDLRASMDLLETQALYFNIVSDVNDTSLPVRVNNAGQNDRDIYNVAAKTDLRGRALHRRPRSPRTTGSTRSSPATRSTSCRSPNRSSSTCSTPIFGLGNGFDLNQSQFLDVEAFSQELRFESPARREAVLDVRRLPDRRPTGSSRPAT